jgi:hypothetical protein
MAMAQNCIAATAPSSPQRKRQPFSRFTLPPLMTARIPAMVASWATVAKDIRKPVDRHMEQK